MGFVGRARSSLERGDTLRAIVTLISGLRRDPYNDDAMRLLVDLVRDEFEGGGIEHEIVGVLLPRADQRELLEQMTAGLRERDHDRAADRLQAEADKRFAPQPVAPQHVEPPTVEPLYEPPATSSAQVHTPPPTHAPRPSLREPSPNLERPRAILAAVEAATRAAEQGESAAPTLPPVDVPVAAADASAEIRRHAADEQRKQAVARERAATRSATRRKRAVTVLALAVVAGLGVVGYVAFEGAQRAAAVAEADAAVRAFDRFDPAALQAIIDLAGRHETADFAERALFVDVLAGGDAEVRLDGWESAAGLAASAISALRQGDIENGLALVTKAERLHANELPTLAARAMFAARRGDISGARRAANAGLDKYPDFALFHEVLIRLAATQADQASFDAAVERLARTRPEHPYTKVGALPDVRGLLFGPPPTCEPTQPSQGDALLTALAELSAICAAADPDEVRKHAEAALHADETFAPARVLLGAALAAQGDGETAAAEFTIAAHLATSRELRLLVQAVAPLTLSNAGRTDLAAPFTTPFPRLRGEGVNDNFDEQIGDARHPNLRTSALADVAQVPWAAEALFARAEYFFTRDQQGPMARAMLKELEDRGIEPRRARTLAMHWRDGKELAPEFDALSRAINDAESGVFEDVLLLPLDDLDGWELPIALDLRAHAHVQVRQKESALTEIAAAPLGIARWPWRARLLAETRASVEPQPQAEPTSAPED